MNTDFLFVSVINPNSLSKNIKIYLKYNRAYIAAMTFGRASAINFYYLLLLWYYLHQKMNSNYLTHRYWQIWR